MKLPADATSTRAGLSLFLLSSATLTFEINLTRLFAVAQFYHFAFMIVSIAVLGFGASGTALALFPGLAKRDPLRSLSGLALASGASMLAAFVITNELPFDSFSIAWDRRQVLILTLHYLALASPFFFSGLAIGLLLTAAPQAAGLTYALNLIGSAVGCFLALLVPAYFGGEGTVILSSGMAALAALPGALYAWRPNPAGNTLAASGSGVLSVASRPVLLLLSLALLAFALLGLGLQAGGRSTFSFLELQLSPYKSLSYALQYPGAEIIFQRWNAFSRVDVVRSSSIHSLPGLSYRYLQPPPPEDGLLVDGDDLSPVLHPGADLGFSGYLAQAVAFRLRPDAEVLVLEPRGGLDVLTALAQGASQVTAVEGNPLIVAAASHVYSNPRVQVVVEADRSYLQRARDQFDVVVLSLTSSYHPVRSGAYSLAEDYRYTVESFQDALRRLQPDGLLVVSRWLQTPPSESLRAFALAVTALEKSGLSPEERIVALRGYNTATLLVKNQPFSQEELRMVRDFAASRAFDLIYAPDIRPEEANQYNILPEPVYYQAFQDLLNTQPRRDFYARYPFEVSPPTDDQPFFGHFFKWSQAGQVWAELGKTWQPFGGAGYFVILALLALAGTSAAVLILLPAFLFRRRRAAGQGTSVRLAFPFLLYFGWIGLAFLLVEIPLIQRFILYLSQPAYALTTVLFAVLLFSGLGSSWSARIPPRLALAALVIMLIALPWVLPVLFSLTLGLPLALRIVLAVAVLAPVGFLMGIPFPTGIRWLHQAHLQDARIDPSGMVPWAWAVNGAASVVSAVLAALLAISLGFQWVFWLGALCYAGAWLTARLASAPPAQPPRR